MKGNLQIHSEGPGVGRGYSKIEVINGMHFVKQYVFLVEIIHVLMDQVNILKVCGHQFLTSLNFTSWFPPTHN